MMNLSALIAASEAALGPRTQWDAVDSITLSRGRYKQLRDQYTSVVTPSSVFAGIALVVSQHCDDRIAVLSGRGVPLGLFSFDTGSVRWFDQKVMKRSMEPTFRWSVRDAETPQT